MLAPAPENGPSCFRVHSRVFVTPLSPIHNPSAVHPKAQAAPQTAGLCGTVPRAAANSQEVAERGPISEASAPCRIFGRQMVHCHHLDVNFLGNLGRPARGAAVQTVP